MKILGYTYSVIEEGDSELIGTFGRFHVKSQRLQVAEDLCQEQKDKHIIEKGEMA